MGIEKAYLMVVENVSSNDSTIDYLKRIMSIEQNLLFMENISI